MTTPSQPSRLTGSARRYLRARAHHLKPVVQIGKTGLAPNVLDAIDHALAYHELIKIRFLDFKDQKRELAETIAQTCNSELIGAVGHVLMFYRQHPEADKRKIQLPS